MGNILSNLRTVKKDKSLHSPLLCRLSVTCTCWWPSKTCPPPSRWIAWARTSPSSARTTGSRPSGAATESPRAAPDPTSSSPGTRSGSPSSMTAQRARRFPQVSMAMLKVSEAHAIPLSLSSLKMFLVCSHWSVRCRGVQLAAEDQRLQQREDSGGQVHHLISCSS